MKANKYHPTHNLQTTQKETIALLGVHVHPLSVAEVLTIIEDAIMNKRHIFITYINAHALNLAYATPWFRDFINTSEVVFCDGFGVKWGAKLLGKEIPHRFTPPDWLDQLVDRANERGFSLFFLGARPGVAQKVAQQFQQTYPNTHIESYHGYFDKTLGSSENEAVIHAINAAAPDILVLGFGMPLQEQWLLENWERVHAHVALTIGAAFDYLAGEVKRGPRWMTDNGLEWLARLIVEPRRLWKRYVIGNPLFLWRIVKQRFGKW